MTVNGIPHERLDEPEKVGLPPITFFYTLDQVAVMLGKTVDDLTLSNLYFTGRTPGKQRIRHIKSVNISADPDKTPDWRITQGELVRWLKVIGVKVYSRGRIV